MEKPASMVIKEFTQRVENDINNSGLPPIILELIIGKYYSQIHLLAEQQVNNETDIYNKTLEAEEGDKNGK